MKQVKKVWEYGFEGTAQQIALAVAFVAPENGSSFRLTSARVAWLTGRSRSTVGRYLRQMRESGFLVRISGERHRIDWSSAPDGEVRKRCWYCGRSFSDGATPARDHQLPLSRGGEDSRSNIVWACASCNSAKSDRTVEEFRTLLSEKWNTEIEFHGQSSS